MSLAEIQSTIELCSKPVRDNVTILHYDKIGKPLLHISQALQTKLIPNISKRAAPSEDNTLPRVHMSPYLIGCIFGYAAMHNDILNLPDTSRFKGRYYIYSVDYEHCIKPNNKLVYDQSDSDEHWLITYNKDTISYKPSYTNEMLFESLTTTVVRGKHLLHTLVFNLNITQPVMVLDQNTNITKGYYKLYVDYYDQSKASDWTIHKVEVISKSEYEKTRLDTNNIKSKPVNLINEHLVVKQTKTFKDWI